MPQRKVRIIHCKSSDERISANSDVTPMVCRNTPLTLNWTRIISSGSLRCDHVSNVGEGGSVFKFLCEDVGDVEFPSNVSYGHCLVLYRLPYGIFTDRHVTEAFGRSRF